ncbi:MAG TPA: hypothetical protein PKJ47_13255 [Candidatus Limiplasma sp.]|nr:hypothetical protein [Candidatus Limiplasma sp.]
MVSENHTDLFQFYLPDEAAFQSFASGALTPIPIDANGHIERLLITQYLSEKKLTISFYISHVISK